ncbi:HAMP domain-containing histidine kinase [bacterium]|nr:HAMP domain-containing histidine kinase [bacterium]
MDIKRILFKTNSIDVEKSLPDATIYITKEGKIQWVNDIACDLLETSKMHLLTSNISDFIETGISSVIAASAIKNAVIAKIVNREIYYDMTAREIEDGYVINLRNISSNSKSPVEEEPSVINREKNNFLVKLSNDLKSPIQSIVGFSQAMADGLGGGMSEQQEKYIRIINKNSSDLMYFVGKLIEHAQTESSPKVPDNKPLDLVSLVNSVVKYNEQLYKGKEVKISIKPDETFKKTILSDSEILRNILQDVLEVILKSVDMGEICITLSNPDSDFLNSKNLAPANYTLIQLSSSALLLSESDLECMFDPYKIVDSTNRKNVLRAIVLASVKNMVQSLKGIVWVESQILKNTSFNILIPEV